jgi:Flp pilus assembly protein TadG
MLLVLLIPLLLAVGVAVDFARMVQFRSDLQNAVDEAALAGAAVFVSSTQATDATTAAQNYFKRAILPINLSVSAPTITPNANDTINPALGSAAAHTVTVTATATVQTTLMSLAAPSMVTITVTGKAANPVVSANLAFPTQLSKACDGNTAYLYQVPANATNTGYDYSKVPVFNSTNYYEIYTSYSPNTSLGTVPAQTLPTFSVNQPLGVMLRNDTNGNVGNSNCTVAVTGANSYGAPSGSSQTFYSSLLMNGESPSQLTNYTYTASVTTSNTTTQTTTTTTVTTGSGQSATSTTSSSTATSTSSNVTNYTISLPPSTLYPSGRTITGTSSSLPSEYDQLAMIFGVNEPGTANSACTTLASNTTTGTASTQTQPPTSNTRHSTTTTTQISTTTTPSTTVTQYSCPTQYRTSQQGTGNCSLYVQTGSGVTATYLNGLTTSSSAPAAAVGTCFNMTSGGAAYSAPSCAQLSALASGSGSSAIAPAAVFWWDDDGGVGPSEQYYSPSGHCSQIGSSSPGYGEDCQYKNMVVALQCHATGGSGTGYTEVVLTQ